MLKKRKRLTYSQRRKKRIGELEAINREWSPSRCSMGWEGYGVDDPNDKVKPDDWQTGACMSVWGNPEWQGLFKRKEFKYVAYNPRWGVDVFTDLKKSEGLRIYVEELLQPVFGRWVEGLDMDRLFNQKSQRAYITMPIDQSANFTNHMFRLLRGAVEHPNYGKAAVMWRTLYPRWNPEVCLGMASFASPIGMYQGTQSRSCDSLLLSVGGVQGHTAIQNGDLASVGGLIGRHKLLRRNGLILSKASDAMVGSMSNGNWNYNGERSWAAFNVGAGGKARSVAQQYDADDVIAEVERCNKALNSYLRAGGNPKRMFDEVKFEWFDKMERSLNKQSISEAMW